MQRPVEALHAVLALARELTSMRVNSAGARRLLRPADRSAGWAARSHPSGTAPRSTVHHAAVRGRAAPRRRRAGSAPGCRSASDRTNCCAAASPDAASISTCVMKRLLVAAQSPSCSTSARRRSAGGSARSTVAGHLLEQRRVPALYDLGHERLARPEVIDEAAEVRTRLLAYRAHRDRTHACSPRLTRAGAQQSFTHWSRGRGRAGMQRLYARINEVARHGLAAASPTTVGVARLHTRQGKD